MPHLWPTTHRKPESATGLQQSASVHSRCNNKKHVYCWPWAIKVQVCNNSISRLGSITSIGMSEDFPLSLLLSSSPNSVDSVSNRENSSSCVTRKKCCIISFIILSTMNTNQAYIITHSTDWIQEVRQISIQSLGDEVAWIYIQHLIAVIISLPHI